MSCIKFQKTNTKECIHFVQPVGTVRVETLVFFIDNHNQLMKIWDWSLQTLKNTEMKAKANDVKSQIEKFEFVFCYLLLEKILKQRENFSRIFQEPTISSSQSDEIGKVNRCNSFQVAFCISNLQTLFIIEFFNCYSCLKLSCFRFTLGILLFAPV